MDPTECSGHSHDHDHADDLGLSLRKYIDIDRVICLNEDVQGAGQSILKLHEERLSDKPSLTSPEDDPELLLTIPFTEAVTMQSITIRNSSSSNDYASPRKVKLFCNREDLDFDDARELDGDQELELLPPEHLADGTIDYPCRPAGRFQNISSVTIFVVDNYDGGRGTEITYVGFKGKGTGSKRLAVETVYETTGMKQDHKVPDEFGGQSLV
ncbi:hypothetical protein MPSEU_001084300 [Mayamaea pseudoterrestris]|nr:hypothetical protein MPSEU_001084300 [Mayamaea pseudoterrestris]